MNAPSPHPVVSVVIPAYNVAHYLPRSIQSVQTQTFQQYEIIVVDDGSTDSVEPVLRTVDHAVRYFRHDTSRGVSAARNTGISHARGRYIAFLDADDCWAPAKLEMQVRLLEHCPALAIVFSDFVHVYPDGSPGPWQGGMRCLLEQRGLNPVPAFPGGLVLNDSVAFALVRHTSFMHTSSVVVRRAALQRVGGFDESLKGAEDLQMWIRLAQAGQAGMIDEVLVHVEQRADSLGHNHRLMSENILRMYEALPEHMADMPKDLAANVRRRCAGEHRSLGWMHFDDGNHRVSRRHYRQSLALHFSARTLVHLAKTYVPYSLVQPLHRLKGVRAGAEGLGGRQHQGCAS